MRHSDDDTRPTRRNRGVWDIDRPHKGELCTNVKEWNRLGGVGYTRVLRRRQQIVDGQGAFYRAIKKSSLVGPRRSHRRNLRLASNWSKEDTSSLPWTIMDTVHPLLLPGKAALPTILEDLLSTPVGGGLVRIS
jgi:hypothetical protein